MKKLLSLLLTVAVVCSLVVVPAMAEDTAHWGTEAAQRWIDAGIFEVENTSENLSRPVTRADFSVMLVKLMGLKTLADAPEFPDVDPSADYANAMKALAAAGIMQGNEIGEAMPGRVITRTEATVLVCRAFSIAPAEKANEPFNDAVADWALPYVNALKNLGIIQGVGDNIFDGTSELSVAAVATMLDNAISLYVNEDGKEITGKVSGIVLIAANNVTLKDAELKNVILAPGAGTSVKVNNTDIDNLLVQSDGTTVTLSKDSSIDVAVLRGDKNTIETVKGAVVDEVFVAGDDAKVAGTGTVNTVEVTSGSGSITTPGTEIIVGEDAGKVTDKGGKTVEPGNTVTNAAASSGGGGGSSSGTTYYEITGVAITGDAKYGETLTAVPTPANASNVTYKWYVEAASTTDFSDKTAVATGTTFSYTGETDAGKYIYVVASGYNDSTATASAAVVVSVKSIAFTNAATMEKGRTLTLAATPVIVNGTITDPTITFSLVNTDADAGTTVSGTTLTVASAETLDALSVKVVCGDAEATQSIALTAYVPVPAASITNTTVTGTKGTALAGTDTITITLVEEEFGVISAGTNVNSWFTTLPAGVLAKVSSRVEGGTTATIQFYNTPTAAADNATVAIAIPASALKNTASGSLSVATGTLTFNIADTYTVTYNLNGGTAGTLPNVAYYAPNATVTVAFPADMAKTGNFNFLGWATTSGGAVAYTSAGTTTFSITENVTLYAVWQAYTVLTYTQASAPESIALTSPTTGVTFAKDAEYATNKNVEVRVPTDTTEVMVVDNSRGGTTYVYKYAGSAWSVDRAEVANWDQFVTALMDDNTDETRVKPYKVTLTGDITKSTNEPFGFSGATALNTKELIIDGGNHSINFGLFFPKTLTGMAQNIEIKNLTVNVNLATEFVPTGETNQYAAVMFGTATTGITLDNVDVNIDTGAGFVNPTNNVYGIFIADDVGTGIEIKGSEITNNYTFNGSYGIWTSAPTKTTLTGNTVIGYDALGITNVGDANITTISGNSFSTNVAGTRDVLVLSMDESVVFVANGDVPSMDNFSSDAVNFFKALAGSNDTMIRVLNYSGSTVSSSATLEGTGIGDSMTCIAYYKSGAIAELPGDTAFDAQGTGINAAYELTDVGEYTMTVTGNNVTSGIPDSVEEGLFDSSGFDGADASSKKYTVVTLKGIMPIGETTVKQTNNALKLYSDYSTGVKEKTYNVTGSAGDYSFLLWDGDGDSVTIEVTNDGKTVTYIINYSGVAFET